MTESTFASVSLPRELWNRVRALPLRDHGYTSPSALVQDAIREKLEDLEARVARRRSR